MMQIFVPIIIQEWLCVHDHILFLYFCPYGIKMWHLIETYIFISNYEISSSMFVILIEYFLWSNNMNSINLCSYPVDKINHKETIGYLNKQVFVIHLHFPTIELINFLQQFLFLFFFQNCSNSYIKIFLKKNASR